MIDSKYTYDLGKESYPFVPTRDLVVFPNMSIQFDVGRNASVSAIKHAMNTTTYVMLCAQKDSMIEKPNEKQLYQIGTLCRVKQIIKTPGGIYRCLVEGAQRAKLAKITETEPHYQAKVRILQNYKKNTLNEIELDALMREIKECFTTYADLLPRMPVEIKKEVYQATEPQELFEAIVFNIVLRFKDKQLLLEADAIDDKLMLLMTIITREIDVLQLESAIHDKVQNAIDKNQREFYIREQIRALKSELGDSLRPDGEDDDIDEMLMKLDSGEYPEEVKEKALTEIDHLRKMTPSSPDAALLRNYLETVLNLPWNARTQDTEDINAAVDILEEDHYGMKRVKDRIVENLAVMKLTGGAKGQIICLYGPPGVGKTSVGKSIARALGRKYVRVSLGGVRDESDIRGHRKTYIGAMPGRIIAALSQAGTKNPVMLLDEIDKMGNDFRGDPSSAMLEVLDSEQNTAFRDHFIELPFDLSEVLFITTANSLDTIAPPLLDRMEVIEMPSYTREEKFNIAKLHLIPKQLKKHGLKPSQLKINNDAVYELIDSYTREAGVRTLERNVSAVCRKTAKKLVSGEAKRVTVKSSDLTHILGHKKYLGDHANAENEVGTVNGLAWTSVGGVIMPLEVLVLDGKGKIELTGSLGDVMKESARIAVSLCRSLAEKYGISTDFYEKKDLHIHAPEGAVPKDGPSAGVTMTTAIISALSGIPVRGDVAMTGEITLRGKVLPIGGLREKTMAAYKAGMKTVIIPRENEGDLDEVDDVVKMGLEFVLADNISQVLDTALMHPAKKPKADLPYELVKKPVRRAKKASV